MMPGEQILERGALIPTKNNKQTKKQKSFL